jgi:hypothetical protein
LCQRHANILPTDDHPPDKYIDYAEKVIDTEMLMGDGEPTMAVGRKSGNEQDRNAEQAQVRKDATTSGEVTKTVSERRSTNQEIEESNTCRDRSD